MPFGPLRNIFSRQGLGTADRLRLCRGKPGCGWLSGKTQLCRMGVFGLIQSVYPIWMMTCWPGTLQYRAQRRTARRVRIRIERNSAGGWSGYDQGEPTRTTRERLDISMRKTASTGRRRGGARAAPKARVTGRVGLDLLVALFLASAIYVGFGGALAVEAPVPEAQAVTVADAANPADAAGASSNDDTDDDTSSGSATLSGYLLAGYVHRGRDDEGNLMPDGHE